MVKTFTELSDRLIPSQRWRKINGYIGRGFTFEALPPCICLAASVKASMHSAAAVGADDRSVQREDTLGMIYILLGVFLCFDALHGCILLLGQYRRILPGVTV